MLLLIIEHLKSYKGSLQTAFPSIMAKFTLNKKSKSQPPYPLIDEAEKVGSVSKACLIARNLSDKGCSFNE